MKSNNNFSLIPSSSIALIFLTIFIALAFSTNSFSHKKKTNNPKLDQDHDYLDSALTQQNLVASIGYFRNAIKESKEVGDSLRFVRNYNHLGIVHLLTRNFKSAAENFEIAFKYAEEYDYEYDKLYMIHNLLESYYFNQSYSKVDSLYPKATQISYDFHNPLYFKNLLIRINTDYKNSEYGRIESFTDSVFQTLDNTGPKAWPDSIKNKLKDDFKSFKYELDLFRGFSYTVSEDQEKIKEGYKILLNINPDSLEYYIQINDDKFNKLSLINSVKADYYASQNDLEKSIHYYKLSSQFKEKAISKYLEALSHTGGTISSMAQFESDLSYLLEINDKNKQIQHYFMLVMILILFILAFVFFHLQKVKASSKKIAVINQELTQANVELMQVDEERHKFFSIISHELKTPVYGISGIVERIKNEGNLSGIVKEDFNTIERISKYLSLLISNILRVTSFDFREVKMVNEPHNLFEVLENNISAVELFSRKKGVTIIGRFEQSIKDRNLIFDRVMIDQVFMNILQNALKYTDIGGAVKFEAYEVREIPGKQKTIRFEVSDSGKGIDPENISKIFDAYKGHTTNNFEQGIGLGLFVAKENLAKFNSEIEVSSEKGKGTTFSFEIDFEIAQDTSIPNESVNGEEPEYGIKILVVDDSELNLLVSKKQVKKIPNTICDTAISGKRAIELVKENNYDLILLDINMPEMDGYETCVEIKKIKPETTIIALTALQADQVISKALSSGMELVISKPFDFGYFQKTIIEYGSKSPRILKKAN